MAQKRKRFPGTKSFEQADSKLFFGREKDISEMLKLLSLDKIILLYSKSGNGKTSLINAGLIPEITGIFKRKPFILRYYAIKNQDELNTDKKSQLQQKETPVSKILEVVNQKSLLNELNNKNDDLAAFLKSFPAKKRTLWYYFKLIQIYSKEKNNPITLIFDQFEDFFNYEQKDIDDFIVQFTELLFVAKPQYLLDKLRAEPDKLKKEDIETLFMPINVIVIFSIISEKISLIYKISEYFPGNIRTRYELLPFNEQQAKEAIKKPAKLNGDSYLSDPFTFDTKCLNGIIEHLRGKEEKIEPFHLQIICAYIEDLVINKNEIILSDNTDKIVIRPNILEHIKSFYDDFYEKRIEYLAQGDSDIENAIHDFFEIGLIYEKDKVKKHIPKGLIFEKYKITEQLLKELEKTHLIRMIKGSGNAIYYELSHDLLIPTILKAKGKRRKEEKNKLKAVLCSLFIGDILKRDPTKAIRIAQYAYKIYHESYSPLLSVEKQLIPVTVHQALCRSYYEPIYNNIQYYSMIFEGHTNEVKYAIFLPDGKDSILSSSNDLTLRLWDKDNKDNCIVFNGHKKPINSTNFKKVNNELLILTASGDNTAILWNTKGEILSIFKGHLSPVNSAVFSPDGTMVLTASADCTAKMWDLKGNELVTFRGHASYVNYAVFSPEGDNVLTASADWTARLWDIEGKQMHVLRGHFSDVKFAMFSNMKSLILTASADCTAILWNREGTKIAVLKHAGDINYAAFSPNDDRIVTASIDSTAKIWDIHGNYLGELNHTNSIVSAIFDNDGADYLTASCDNTAKKWRKDDDLTFAGHERWVNYAAFSPDNSEILTSSSDNTIRLWSLEKKSITTFKHYTNNFTFADFSTDSKLLLAGGRDNRAVLRNLEDKSEHLFNHQGPVNSAVFSPDCKEILTASADYSIKRWDLEGNELKAFWGHTSFINHAVYSKDGSMIASSSADGSVKIWNLNGKELMSIDNLPGEVNYTVWSQVDKSKILIICNSCEAFLYDVENKENYIVFREEGNINSAVFSNDGSKVLTASASNMAGLWDNKGTKIATLKGHNSFVNCASFSPDGKTILTASYDNTAKLWNLKGEEVVTLGGHKNGVTRAAFSPDGSLIVTSSFDHTVKLWHLSGEEIITLKGHEGGVFWCGFSPDGKKIVTISDDNTIKVWLSPKAIYEWLLTAKIAYGTEKEINTICDELINKSLINLRIPMGSFYL